MSKDKAREVIRGLLNQESAYDFGNRLYWLSVAVGNLDKSWIQTNKSILKVIDNLNPETYVKVNNLLYTIKHDYDNLRSLLDKKNLLQTQ